jgi:hypothetical protein
MDAVLMRAVVRGIKPWNFALFVAGTSTETYLKLKTELKLKK